MLFSIEAMFDTKRHGRFCNRTAEDVQGQQVGASDADNEEKATWPLRARLEGGGQGFVLLAPSKNGPFLCLVLCLVLCLDDATMANKTPTTSACLVMMRYSAQGCRSRLCWRQMRNRGFSPILEERGGQWKSGHVLLLRGLDHTGLGQVHRGKEKAR